MPKKIHPRPWKDQKAKAVETAGKAGRSIADVAGKTIIPATPGITFKSALKLGKKIIEAGDLAPVREAADEAIRRKITDDVLSRHKDWGGRLEQLGENPEWAEIVKKAIYTERIRAEARYRDKEKRDARPGMSVK